ncbi:hypothetical protein BDV97DRAFT_352161 [Delphinella strobiligena]|nr:hypothetical protein BDV97DRAFT_352161 [Delphinella strobiligena]
MAATLQVQHPWLTKTPIIVNAPMSEFAGPELATALHASSSFGFIGAIPDIPALRAALETISKTLLNKSVPSPEETLPLGLGILCFYQEATAKDLLELISELRPAAIWLFAPKNKNDYTLWSRGVRAASPMSKIWIQVSSVSAALKAVENADADVLVLQGSDAGGHGLSPGASVIALLPEATDALVAAGYAHIPLLAAGGIVDGRGAAAALAAGAAGIVMGTAFLAAEECQIHAAFRDAVLETSDGALNTIRATVFDELPGENVWPEGFDGRALVAQSWKDHLEGMDVKELRRLYKIARTEDAQGFGADNRRAAIWAGSGVGLVNEVRPAGVIVEDVRRDAKRALEQALSRL